MYVVPTLHFKKNASSTVLYFTQALYIFKLFSRGQNINISSEIGLKIEKYSKV